MVQAFGPGPSAWAVTARPATTAVKSLIAALLPFIVRGQNGQRSTGRRGGTPNLERRGGNDGLYHYGVAIMIGSAG